MPFRLSVSSTPIQRTIVRTPNAVRGYISRVAKVQIGAAGSMPRHFLARPLLRTFQCRRPASNEAFGPLDQPPRGPQLDGPANHGNRGPPSLGRLPLHREL